MLPSFNEFRQHHIKIHLPAVQQSHSYDCGAAAFRSVCEFFGVGPEDQHEFIKLCNTSHSKGTRPEDMIRAAAKVGLKTAPKKGMTLDELEHYMDNGIPVICPIQAWTEGGDRWKAYDKRESGHYVVVIGYDDQKIYFVDPLVKGSRGGVPVREFEQRWKDVDADGERFTNYGIAMWKNGKTHPEPESKTKHVP